MLGFGVEKNLPRVQISKIDGKNPEIDRHGIPSKSTARPIGRDREILATHGSSKKTSENVGRKGTSRAILDCLRVDADSTEIPNRKSS